MVCRIEGRWCLSFSGENKVASTTGGGKKKVVHGNGSYLER